MSSFVSERSGSPSEWADGTGETEGARSGHPTVSRRTLLGLLVAAPVLTVVARASGAIIPSLPEPSDGVDLGDLQDLAAAPTSGPGFITVVINPDGTASFDLPRCEVGQGITTAFGMIIGDELDLSPDKVHVSLSDANPALADNQLTGGSNSIRSLYMPVRTAASVAKLQLLAAAATQMGVPASKLSVADGVITAPDGRTAGYGELTHLAAVATNRLVEPQLKAASAFTSIGTARNRVDALDAVTGRKQFTMDLDVPGALPAMLHRPPTLNAKVASVANLPAVKAMPGITHVGVMPDNSAVAVRGRTFGQCIDAVRALQVTWTGGTEDASTEKSLLASLKAAELPFVPDIPGTTVIDTTYEFMFASNSPLETGCTIADVKPGQSAEIWSCLKVPLVAQSQIALALGLVDVLTAVTVHVVPGGGSFGRHLFFDSAMEAALVSNLFGVPVKLMWARTDDFRAGRTHPIATSRVKLAYAAGSIVSLNQRHTSVSTDFSHSFGDQVTAIAAAKFPANQTTPGFNTLGLAQTIFEFTANVPYQFGVTTQLLNEIDEGGFHTGSSRNIYSPDVCTAIELSVDQVAKALGQDPYQLRRASLKPDPSDPKTLTGTRAVDVLDAVAKAGNWGRPMAPGTAQGIAFHSEYKGVCACLVEIDCTPATVNRKIRDAYTGPRVTKVVFAVDVGQPINTRGLEAQMQGGIMDGIASALTNSLHFDKGYFAEGSWDNYYYTRQWNVPPQLQIIIMPPTTGNPGGAGEFGVAATKAAVACAYARATGTIPTRFPINHDGPLGFDVIPQVPPVPQSPTDGLTNYS